MKEIEYQYFIFCIIPFITTLIYYIYHKTKERLNHDKRYCKTDFRSIKKNI